ncbi:amino acid ABC transporter permease [Synechocystis sp. LKSZ1]|uniref:amino acid ABC transporter permease n=1 Tax=Synechocystis sp. LKSZ1 TaxID=3144951 RepID=UPI00336C2C5E
MADYRWNWLIFFEKVATGGERYYQWLLAGLGWTVATSLLAWCLALILGLGIGIIRTTPLRWLALLGEIYVEIFRNIPLIVQMFLWFFVLPDLVPPVWGHWLKQEMPLPEFTTAVVSLAFFTAARIAEQVKAGLLALPPGQSQAALALGLTWPQAYRYVLLPVALRWIIPPLTSELMNIFKNSSVALTIGLLELTAVTRQINEYTFQSFEIFTLATVLYALLALMANRLMAWIEALTTLPGYGLGQGRE